MKTLTVSTKKYTFNDFRPLYLGPTKVSLSRESEKNIKYRNVSAAKNLIGRVGKLVAEECIQLHGGIGMTWEYNLQNYAKRLIMIDHLMGDSDHHIEKFKKFSKY